MRIVYLNPVGSVGGAERVLLSVLAAVRQAAPHVELLLVASTPGSLLGQAESLGVETVLLPMPDELAGVGDSRHRGRGWWQRSWGLARHALSAAPAALEYGRRLGNTLRDISPDLVHSNGIKSHLLARLARLGKVPIIWHVHDFYGDRPFVRRFLPWARKGVAGAIAISRAVAHDVSALMPAVPTTVIHNAIDVTAFAPGPGHPALLDRLAGLPQAPAGVVRVGLVATYARWKGHDVFLQAIAQLVAAQPASQARFYVVGGPIYHTQGSQFSEAELRAMVRSLGIEAHVGFIRFQEDPVEIYRGLDIVVHASTRPEPFGLTIVEAMACGKPVVVAQAGGAAELFTHDHDAVGVPPGRPEQLAAALAGLVGNPERRRRLGENARLTASQRFSQTRLGAQVLEAYTSFLGPRWCPSRSPVPAMNR
jgi:glycosyltransferase involved in cell wall biosynthesis